MTDQLESSSAPQSKKRLPFWRRTVYVGVRGQASCVEKTEFNWALLKPIGYVFLGLIAIIGGLVFLWMLSIGVGLTAQLVAAFPTVAAILLLILLFDRKG